MKRYTVRLCREVTEYVDVEVVAASEEEACSQVDMQELPAGLTWEPCEGNEYTPYVVDAWEFDPS